MLFHFADAEYSTRLAKASFIDRGLDALLMFAPESHY
jgi:hypothetical protein